MDLFSFLFTQHHFFYLVGDLLVRGIRRGSMIVVVGHQREIPRLRSLSLSLTHAAETPALTLGLRALTVSARILIYSLS